MGRSVSRPHRSVKQVTSDCGREGKVLRRLRSVGDITGEPILQGRVIQEGSGRFRARNPFCNINCSKDKNIGSETGSPKQTLFDFFERRSSYIPEY